MKRIKLLASLSLLVFALAGCGSTTATTSTGTPKTVALNATNAEYYIEVEFETPYTTSNWTNQYAIFRGSSNLRYDNVVLTYVSTDTDASKTFTAKLTVFGEAKVLASSSQSYYTFAIRSATGSVTEIVAGALK
jgi:ethanolamine utilization protein EutP (predicted NTPase)